ncbi:MAG: DNA repair protein RecO [Candidatus Ancillula sp.]|jgi:DNA repair protein RecO (recombination protein O)|nr:DNA repair protein RecO [Candidatus Ancillula sp.]
MMQSLVDEAIVLRRTKLKETDLIITLLTRSYGKVSVVAKGARKVGSRFAGLELFNRVRVKWTLSKRLGYVNEVEVEQGFGEKLAAEYELFECASQMTSLTEMSISDEFMPTEQQYLLLLRALKMLLTPLPDGLTANLVSLSFTLRTLALIGFELDTDNVEQSGVYIPKGLTQADVSGFLDALMAGDWAGVAELTRKNPNLEKELSKSIAMFAMSNLDVKLKAF